MAFTNRVATIEPVKAELPAKPEGKIDILTREPNKEEPPFIGYSDIYKKPYSADYFNLSYFKELTDKTDVNHIRSKVKEVEEFVKDEIQTKGLKDSVSTFKSIVQRIMDYVGEGKKDEILLNRISEFMSLVRQKRSYDKRIEKRIEALGIKK